MKKYFRVDVDGGVRYDILAENLEEALDINRRLRFHNLPVTKVGNIDGYKNVIMGPVRTIKKEPLKV